MTLYKLKKVSLYLGLFISLMLASGLTHAGIKSIGCNGCTPSQMLNKAKNSGIQNGTSYVVVIDFKDRYAMKFRQQLTFNYGEPEVQVTPTSLSADEQHDVDIYLQYRDELVRVLRHAESLPLFNSELNGPAILSETAQKSKALLMKEMNRFSTTSNTNDTFTFAGELDVQSSPYLYLQSSEEPNNVYDNYITSGKGIFASLISSTLKKVDIPLANDMGVYIKIRFFKLEEGQLVPNGWLNVSLDPILETFTPLSGRDHRNQTVPLNKGDFTGKTFKFDETDNTSNEFRDYIQFTYTPVTCTVVRKEPNGLNGGQIFIYRCE
jgi:hypothetical protein